MPENANLCRACNGRGVWVSRDSVEACRECVGDVPDDAPLPDGQAESPPASAAPLVARLPAHSQQVEEKAAAVNGQCARLLARCRTLAKRHTRTAAVLRDLRRFLRSQPLPCYRADARRAFAAILGTIGVPTAALEAGVVQDLAAVARWMAGLVRAGHIERGHDGRGAAAVRAASAPGRRAAAPRRAGAGDRACRWWRAAGARRGGDEAARAAGHAAQTDVHAGGRAAHRRRSRRPGVPARPLPHAVAGLRVPRVPVGRGAERGEVTPCPPSRCTNAARSVAALPARRRPGLRLPGTPGRRLHLHAGKNAGLGRGGRNAGAIGAAHQRTQPTENEVFT